MCDSVAMRSLLRCGSTARHVVGKGGLLLFRGDPSPGRRRRHVSQFAISTPPRARNTLIPFSMPT